MPTATARPPRPRPHRRRHSEEEMVPTPPVLEPDQGEGSTVAEGAFDPFAQENDGGLPFMDAVGMITDSEWQGYWLYLYRLDPAVKNAEDENKYIARWQVAMTEDEIKAQHGGGKYMFILKENVIREVVQQRGYSAKQRRYKFRIDGTPVLQRGQVVEGASPAAAGNSPAPGRDETEGAALARALPEILRNAASREKNEPGMAQSLDIMSQATKAALTIVTESTRQQVMSTTGNQLGDRLLEMFLTRDKQSEPPQRSKVEDKLIEIALDRIQNPERQSGGGLGQLGELKDLLGVDSIVDLIKPSGGDSWKTKLVEMGASLLANLPQLFQLYMQNQQMQYQRALQMRGQPPIAAAAEIPPVTIPGQPAAIAPLPTQPQPIPPGANPMDPTVQALLDIAMCYQAGQSGDAAASFIQAKYPQFVVVFTPLLENRDQVMLFAKSTPPLSHIANDEEFPEFLDQFIQEMLHPTDEEGPGQQPA